LQAVAEGGKLAAASSQKSKEAREARFDKYLSQYAEIEGIENAEARERVKFMLDFGMKDLDLKGKDLDRALRWSTDNMQDITSRLNIATGSADTRRGQNLDYNASIAGNTAKSTQLKQAAVNDAIKIAEGQLQMDLKYRNAETPQADKDAMLKDRVRAILAAGEELGGGGGTGTPGMPSGFVADQ
jgi:hypothetical protein